MKIYSSLFQLEGKIFYAVQSLFGLPTFLLFMMIVVSNQKLFGLFACYLFDRELLLIWVWNPYVVSIAFTKYTYSTLSSNGNCGNQWDSNEQNKFF